MSLRTILLSAEKIKYYGTQWSMEPIFDEHNNEKFIVGWYLKFIPYENGTTKDTYIMTSRIVEIDCDQKNSKYIFKTRSGNYYYTDIIDHNFEISKWNKNSALRMYDILHRGELIAYATAADILKKEHANENGTDCIENIEYIKPVRYNIIQETPEQSEYEDEKYMENNIFS